MTAADAGSGAEIDDRVGRPHRVLVVFDDDQRVAGVAQPAQRADQPVVVPRVQPDARLVQDVQHAAQPRTDLAGQPDPLGFAAGERRGGPRQRQVIQPDAQQEPDPRTDLFQGFAGDQRRGAVEPHVGEEFGQRLDRQPAHLRQRPRPAVGAGQVVGLGCTGQFLSRRGRDRHRTRLPVQPPAAAIGTPHRVHVFFQMRQLHLVLRRLVPLQQFRDQPVERAGVLLRLATAPPRELQRRLGAPQPDLPGFLRQVPPLRRQHRAGFQPERLVDRLGDVLVDVASVATHVAPLAEDLHRSLAERQRVVRDQQLRDERVQPPQPVAGVAHAGGAVERKQLRRRRRERLATFPARVTAGKDRVAFGDPRRVRVGVGDADGQRPVADLQRRVDGFVQPRDLAAVRFDTIDDDFDVVPPLAVQRRRVGQPVRLAVDADAGEPLFTQVLEQVEVLALLSADDRGQDPQRVLGVEPVDPADDRVAGLGGDRHAAIGTVPRADPCVQHPQEVVDLGDRPDGRPGVPPGRFLRDRDRRRQARHQIDVRLGHLAHELAGVIGQALDVPPLAFGVQRVEGQRRFSAAGDPRKTDQLAPLEGQVDVVEVVFPRALHADFGLRHVGAAWRSVGGGVRGGLGRRRNRPRGE